MAGREHSSRGKDDGGDGAIPPSSVSIALIAPLAVDANGRALQRALLLTNTTRQDKSAVKPCWPTFYGANGANSSYRLSWPCGSWTTYTVYALEPYGKRPTTSPCVANRGLAGWFGKVARSSDKNDEGRAPSDRQNQQNEAKESKEA